MGIPAFYRWLGDRYPLSVVEVREEAPAVINGVQVPLDTSRPNPNGVEFDNLYLDMNGIVHPCFHPEGQPAPKSYDEVYKAVFAYIDHLFSMIRPRKLLYLAIDGVAPRAKMNQQRTRRFRAAKNAADAAAEAEKLEGEFQLQLEKICHPADESKMDSNLITPGTEFMASLSSALRYYICLRLNKDPGWRGTKVILSDASVPGEGEHKIASYIRSQRGLPGSDPNTRHCLYGLDADLIMLALATHEIHFSILREDVRVVNRYEKFKQTRNSTTEGKEGKALNHGVNSEFPIKKFQLLNVWVLRDYLHHEMRIFGAKEKIDLERLIDDFVFMCLFVGNDFLPHVPSLEISEGAIDLLISIYKKEFAAMGGYLTNSSEVNLERVELFLKAVGSHESAIFRRRIQLREMSSHFGGTMEIEQKTSSIWMKSFERSLNSVSNGKLNCTTSATANHDDQIEHIKEWKGGYYAEKFEVNSEDEHQKLKRNAVKKYVEGICWVMQYYYQGVCSWQWFYPYHYAPFASDFVDLNDFEVHFKLGVPFKPFDQLMAVLPAARNLMTNPSSRIVDFYPKDFELDLNGKRFSWQAVCKLPFVDETRLLAEIESVEHTLTDDERQRNSWTMDVLFVHFSHPLASNICSFYKRKKDHPKLPKAKLKKRVAPKISNGMNGFIYISDKTALSPEIYSPIEGMEVITKNETIFVYYKVPPLGIHISHILDGAILPKKLIRKNDVKPPPVLWHERSTLRRREPFQRPIPRGIAGHRLANIASSLVSNYYSEKKKLINASNLNKTAMNGQCNGNEVPEKQTSGHESNSNNRILGKRKHRGGTKEKGKVQVMGQDNTGNTPNLGKRTHHRAKRYKRKRNKHSF